MDKILVFGGRSLMGEIEIDGAKNSVLPIMAATLLNASGEEIAIENVPCINDVLVMRQILDSLGVKTKESEKALTIDTSCLISATLPDGLTKEMRSSVFLMGPLLVRFGKVEMCRPGGCAIGLRPIDLHIKGLKALGAKITETGETITVTAEKLTGANIQLDIPSVGATENIMMAATGAWGETVLSNAAREPEITDLQNFLNIIGADIRGAGTGTIRIKGPVSLRGGHYRVIPDRIVAGTLLIAAGITGGDVWLKNVIPSHMEAIIAKLREAGLLIEEGDNWLRVRTRVRRKRLEAVEKLSTQVYPGFPTDLQAPMMVLLALAKGKSFLYEHIFDNRLKHAKELQKLGARITLKERKVEIEGVERFLPGKAVESTDLRAGAALVLAALTVRGKTEVYFPWHIDRGYDKLEGMLAKLGANIYRVGSPYQNKSAQG